MPFLKGQLGDLKHTYDKKNVFLYSFGIVQAAPAILP